MKTYTGRITTLQPNQVFVFGSNTQGRHGKGAALQAMAWGARYGIPMGQQGQTYAIVTKDLTLPVHPSIDRKTIITQISILYWHAYWAPEVEYLIAYSGNGTNLNGYTPREMELMFARAAIWPPHEYSTDTPEIPANIVFEEKFAEGVEYYLNLGK